MQPSALMLPDCQWRAFDGAPFAIDQDILAHTEPSVSLRHWKRVVASIPRPFKRACHGPPPSGHLHLPPSFHCFAWTRSIRRVAQLGRIFDPKQQEKAAGFGEKQRPSHISGIRYCVHKKDQDVLSARLRRASARVSPLQTISERTWLVPRQASATLVPSGQSQPRKTWWVRQPSH